MLHFKVAKLAEMKRKHAFIKVAKIVEMKLHKHSSCAYSSIGEKSRVVITTKVISGLKF